MTRKRARKILMAVTCDGYGHAANDLIKKYRSQYPHASNKQICVKILAEIHMMALRSGDWGAWARSAAQCMAINGVTLYWNI